MKDLKYLYTLENLLQEANNDMVRQACEAGQICIGSVCYQIPEVLLNLPGTFSVRLTAPRTSSMEMGTYYMTSLTCEYCRAILERGLEGGYQFLDCMFDPCSCSQLADMTENIEMLKLCTRDHFFMQHMDTPMKDDENGVRHMTRQSRIKILDKLRDAFGVDVSDDALKAAVAQHNEMCRLLNQMGEYRKEQNPRITGYEYYIFCLATYVCPKDLLIPILRETVEELKTREPDEKNSYRARVVLVGSEIDDPSFIRTIEDSGALIVADRFCLGTFPGRQEIILNDQEDILLQICRQYVKDCQCPRYMNTEKINSRKAYIDELAKEYHADGIIIEQMKFCNFWGYERALDAHVLGGREYGWPVLSIDRAYITGSSGQLRTRVQAFVESVEIKKIQGGNQ